MAILQSQPLEVSRAYNEKVQVVKRDEEPLFVSREDQDFWLRRCGETLDALLRKSGSYTFEQRLSHLRLLADTIIPSFGPQPSKATCKPLLTGDGSPFEPSWNITDSGASAIRFSFEPLGLQGGAANDPFAQKIVAAMLPHLRRVATGVDTRWFEQFMASFFLTDEETRVAQARLPPGVRAPQSFLAFDLDGGKPVLKAYFFPILKHVATGRTNEAITFETIRSLSPGGANLTPAANAVETYLSSSQCPIPVEMIALDAIDPAAGARVKVYGRTESNAFEVVRHVCTLGGKIGDADTVEGLRILESVWHLLHNEPRPMDGSYSKPGKVKDTRHKGVCYGFELKPGAEFPEVKVYVPMWQYAESDTVIARNLAEIYQQRGWKIGSRYADALHEAL
jgi:DMATS type aromatic prenyltransferase